MVPDTAIFSLLAPLHFAAISTGGGGVTTVHAILQNGAEVDAKQKKAAQYCTGQSMKASSTRNRLPCSSKIDVNAVAKKGKTPLHKAVTFCPGTTIAIPILIDRGADLELRDVFGMSPLVLAVATKHSTAKRRAAARSGEGIGRERGKHNCPRPQRSNCVASSELEEVLGPPQLITRMAETSIRHDFGGFAWEVAANLPPTNPVHDVCLRELVGGLNQGWNRVSRITSLSNS